MRAATSEFGTFLPCQPRRAMSDFRGVKQPCRRNPETAEVDPDSDIGPGGRRTVLGLRRQQQATSIQNNSGLFSGTCPASCDRLL